MSNPNHELIESLDPALNVALTKQIIEARDGENLTKVAAAGEDYIRTHIRESGFMSKILKREPITNEELDRVLEHDRPVRFVELETNHKGAAAVPFNVSTDTEFFYGPKAAIEFFPIKTPVFTKNVNELRTYRHDIQKVVTEHSLNDIETQEDAGFIALCDLIVGDYTGVSPVTGRKQHFKAGDGTSHTTAALSGGMSNEVYTEMKKLLGTRLNLGLMLMNTNTALEFEKYDSLAVGDDLKGKMFKQGLKGIGDAVVGGVPHVYTIKDDLVPDNVIYIFTEPAYLGKFYVLEDIRLFVKRDEDQIKMHASEVIGAGIINGAGVVKVDLNEVPSEE